MNNMELINALSRLSTIRSVEVTVDTDKGVEFRQIECVDVYAGKTIMLCIKRLPNDD